MIIIISIIVILIRSTIKLRSNIKDIEKEINDNLTKVMKDGDNR